MSQIETIQAGVQVEAARELGKLLRPFIQHIVRQARTLRSTENTRLTMQPKSTAQDLVKGPAGHIQIQEG